MITTIVPLFPLFALLILKNQGWLKVFSRLLIGISFILIILNGWFLIDLYDETQDFIEIRNRYEQSQ